MARASRIEYPGAFYHVMNRGNTGMAIFRSERDREKFLEYVGRAVTRYDIKVHTYCLISTHYHFLIEMPQANLSQAVKWINVAFSVYFNRKQRRVGHLFQGRFKAVLVEADEYLKQLSRYIHLNPVRAKMVEHCKDYPWSSYRALGGYVESTEWLETDWLLSHSEETALRKNGTHLTRSDAGIANPSDEVVGGVVLGGVDFVNWVKRSFLNKESNRRAIPQLKRLTPRPTSDAITQVVCDEFGCEREIILQKGKKKNLARDVVIYLCRELTGETGVALGRRFDICGAAIAIRHNQIANQLPADGKLKRRIDRIRKQIGNI